VKSKIPSEQREALYQQAVELIRDEWLAEGTTPEEWERSERVAELFSRQVASGEDADNIVSRWRGLTAQEILAQAESLNSPDRRTQQMDGVGNGTRNQRRARLKSTTRDS
jgi:hypothetical protein